MVCWIEQVGIDFVVDDVYVGNFFVGQIGGQCCSWYYGCLCLLVQGVQIGGDGWVQLVQVVMYVVVVEIGMEVGCYWNVEVLCYIYC